MYNVLANVVTIIEAVEEHWNVMTPTVRSLVSRGIFLAGLSLFGFGSICFTWGNLADRFRMRGKARRSGHSAAKELTNTLFPKRPLQKIYCNIFMKISDTAIELF